MQESLEITSTLVLALGRDISFSSLLKRQSLEKTVMLGMSPGPHKGDLRGKLLICVISLRHFAANGTAPEGCVSASSSHDVTTVLRAWCQGDPQALGKLIPLIYRELHQAAHRQMAGERSAHTLQTSALVNEVYLRLVGLEEMSWQNRSHFLAVCAKLMRQILIDYARTRLRLKRGGGAQEISLDSNLTVFGKPHVDLLALNDALTRLATFDERKSKVVELRFFGGLTAEETSGALGISVETVHRDWKVAKVWLLHELIMEHRDGA